ncbi:restriction endonuclease subunit S [Acinetobacter lwoffii]|uniref:Restriction endonuclease subunit S n=2 Tax=Acinetobacter TaxID=469 RepID=A0A558F1R1_9GAMM|nr:MULTISPECIES: restriction endonuclease subunit S [Pseudomonadota]MDP1369431.1 restriction endonuclease subunit S [Acinetobacter lwoffii]MDP1388876.1 restriction endonuclease subunit S [Acinetobacter lwoffii]MDP1446511.1 restriction endonuclease subunit S [Acinetobacter lwoffii]POU25372.1 restriction endonuclease subunit S [Acinetobacter sp. ACNIH3]POV79638.1 restriction endonuclease subunit S [Acinetobacter sp. ACNIH4]
MAKYQKYAEYKDSGIDWLGSIPANWHLNKLRYLFDFNKGLTITKENLEDEGIPCVSYGEVHSKFGFEVDPLKHDLKCVNVSYLKTSDNALLNKGDFVFADTSEDLKGSGNFTHLVNNEQVFAGYHTIIAKPKDPTSSRFYAYLFDSKEFRSQIQLAVKGVKVFSITQAILRASDIWLPSKSEQIQIANFLDHETAKIDSLIEKQKKLIELLKEKRQAVISHAVTKGLNPDVAMKDSGVEWLGQVPEHWETTKIKYVAELTPKKSELLNTDNRLCTFVPMEKLKLDSLIKDEEKPISEVIGGYTYFRDGDLLLAKVTPCFENKNMVIASGLKNGIGFGSSEIYVLRSNSKVDSQFLYYRLQEDQFMELGVGSMTGAGGLKRVPSEFLNNFEFCLPPLKEQFTITEYLNQYLIKSELLMNKSESAIQLMQERRTALISSAVTGKIDVRNWQNPQQDLAV